MSKGVTERSMCRRGNIAGKGVFVLLTLIWMALFIAVAVESSKCTVCEKNSDRCSSSIWDSGASDNEAFRATFAVGDSGDFGTHCAMPVFQNCWGPRVRTATAAYALGCLARRKSVSGCDYMFISMVDSSR